MRFIVMGMATKGSEAAPPPKPEAFAAMQEYNDDLAKRGIGEGFTPNAEIAKVKLQ